MENMPNIFHSPLWFPSSLCSTLLHHAVCQEVYLQHKLPLGPNWVQLTRRQERGERVKWGYLFPRLRPAQFPWLAPSNEAHRSCLETCSIHFPQ